MASTAGRLIRGSLFRNAELFVMLAVTFVITPFLVRALGARMYGFWTLLGTFIGYYGLLDFGLTSAASRYISRSLGQEDAAEFDRVVDTAFFLFSLIGMAVAAAAALSAAAAPLFVKDPAEAALFRRLILILGAATAIGFPFKVYTGILTSHIRYDAIAWISIAKTVLSNAAIYVLLRGGRGIMTVAVVSLAASLAQNCATYAFCRAQFPLARVRLFRFDAGKVRMMFDYSWKTFVCQLGDLLRFQIDSVLIAWFLSVSLVTPYFIGARLVSGFGQLVLSSVGVMLPVFSQYEGRGDYAAIRSALLKVTTLAALLSAFIGFSIIFYGNAFILRWMGPGFDAGYRVAAILCAGSILGLSQYPGVQMLYGLSKHDSLAVLNTCEAILNVALSLLLMKRYGLYGVALGSTIETLLFTLLIQPVFICRAVGLSVKTYLVDTLFATIAKAALPLGLYFYAVRGAVTPDYLRLGACVALQGALFLPAAYFFMIGADERRFVRDAARALLKRAGYPRYGGTLNGSAGV